MVFEYHLHRPFSPFRLCLLIISSKERFTVSLIDDRFDGVVCALLCRMYAHNRTSAELKVNLLCSSMQDFQCAALIPANHDGK